MYCTVLKVTVTVKLNHHNLGTNKMKLNHNIIALFSLINLLIREYQSNSKHADTTHHLPPSLHREDEYIGSHGGAWSPCTHVRHSLNFDYGLALYLQEEFHPKSVLEFGSGLGLYVDFFYRKCNVTEAIGIEPIIMKLPHDISIYKSFDNFIKYPAQSTFNIKNYNNITKDEYDEQFGNFDMVYSIEVAEHIDYKYHYALADFLSSHTNHYLMFSAAHPGQTGNLVDRTLSNIYRFINKNDDDNDNDDLYCIIDNNRYHNITIMIVTSTMR